MFSKFPSLSTTISQSIESSTSIESVDQEDSEEKVLQSTLSRMKMYLLYVISSSIILHKSMKCRTMSASSSEINQMQNLCLRLIIISKNIFLKNVISHRAHKRKKKNDPTFRKSAICNILTIKQISH